VRGVGQVAVSHVELTNGVVRCQSAGWPSAHKKLLGRPAPCRGFPVVDFEKNTAAAATMSFVRCAQAPPAAGGLR
jgi:hypothetical protein